MFTSHKLVIWKALFTLIVLSVSHVIYATSTDVPGAIGKLTAVVTTNTARLSWEAPITPALYPITDYILQYKEQAQTKYTTVKDGKNIQTSYMIEGLEQNTLYNIRILALNAKGLSPYKVYRFRTKTNAIPGVCGSMNNKSTPSFPSGTELCKSGTVSVMDDLGADGQYNWMCLGIRSVRNATCKAYNSSGNGGGSTTSTAPKLFIASPYVYSGEPGKKIDVSLFWEVLTDREREYLQFMHLDNGQSSYTVDDHDFLYIWSNNMITDVRTIKIPETIEDGLYDILVGLSGVNSAGVWENFPLQIGDGVTNDGDNRYKVGTLAVGVKAPPTPIPPVPAPFTYDWTVGNWGTCSVTCDGGEQIRSVSCLRNDGETVLDSFCTSTRPVLSQSCNTIACVPNPAPTPTPTPTPNVLTTINLASPQSYNAIAGNTKTLNLNWVRTALGDSYLQFMHFDNGTTSFSVDDHMVDSTNWSGNAVDTRTINIPSSIPTGKYDILVGLSGGNPWQNIALNPGNGVTNVGNNRYKVGTINITGITPTPTPTPTPSPTPTPVPPVTGNGTAAGPRTSSFVNSGPIRATNGQVISGLRITSTSGPCIVVSGVSNVIIRDNDFTQCGNNADGTAVRIDGGSNNNLVEHNRISGNIGEGITVKYSAGNTVRKNVFAGIRDYGEKYRHGIEVSWSDRVTVADNIFGEGSYPSDILSGYEISDSNFTGNEFINVTIIEPTGASFTIGDASDLDGSPANPGSNNYVARNMVRSQYGGVPAGVFGSTSNTVLENNCFSAGVQAYNYSGIFNGVVLRNNVINQERSFYGGDSGRRDVPYISGFDTNIDSTDCSRVP